LADTTHIHLSNNQRLDWLRLIRSENVGPRTFRSLVNHCGGAGTALTALPDLARRGGASRPLRVCPRDEAEREIAVAQRLGARFVALGEADYPAYLQTVRGNAAVLRGPLIAMVGSRNASAAGVKMAERLSDERSSGAVHARPPVFLLGQ
jgi:DNA processing protein